MKKITRWFYSASRYGGSFKKIAGFEAWFYTGPTAHFGHEKGKHDKGK